MRSGLIKCILKVLDENQDKLVWEHLCYAPSGLYIEYLQKFDIERNEMGEAVSRWAREDFNFDLPMTTAKDIKILRELVLDKYSSAYPHLMRKSNTDHQGWIRVWVSTHMEKDLIRNGYRR